ncbi:hypothetical protein DEHALATV1_0075 [Dehalococcoides mccartyi]|uniref:HTH cro/C1-type domain-containing protein n=1 Tax=Dehalococcoides mccartyi TaxID=61435 RepID=A0AB33HN49_9CHLR|nr:hypothetical protein [Dehalococcoides mccartyi]BAZ96703.1 hypothetical protein DEHALATV1_0075 [Dehalococcoides mccartyi]
MKMKLKNERQQRSEPFVLTTVGEAITELELFKDDVKVVLEYYKRSPAAMAKVVGVNRRKIHDWLSGRSYPREPITLLSIMKCADKIRALKK